MLLALPARDCSSRLPMDSNHWNRGHEIEWKWKTTWKERIKDLLRTKEDKGLSASVVICMQGADCWGDVQYSWPGRLFTFFTASVSTQTPFADADRLCGSLCWTTTSKDNSLHDEEEKAKEQQFKTDKFWPMPILYQYSPQSYFWSPPSQISSNLFAKNINGP